MKKPKRRLLVIAAAILFFLFTFGGTAVRLFTDFLWYSAEGYRDVFTTTLGAEFITGVVAGGLAAIFLWINLEVARGTAPEHLPGATPRLVPELFRRNFLRLSRRLNPIFAVVFGLLVGLTVSSSWSSFLLWRNAESVGVRDPQFNKDISFFLFSLPFYRVTFWAVFAVLVLTVLAVVGFSLVSGGVFARDAQRFGMRPQVAVHLSLLLAGLWLLKAWGYRLQAYELSFSPRGTITGASYTDIHAQLPALTLLTFIAIASALLFGANFFKRFRGWLLPAAAVGLWAIATVLVGLAYPAAIQQFVVKPNEFAREEPYIKRNIAATRAAFDLDKIDTRQFAASTNLTPEVIAANQTTIENMRVWGPGPLLDILGEQQELRQYYRFNDVDVDRYMVDGRLRQVLVSAREIDVGLLDDRSRNWINEHLAFTHGNGVVGTLANGRTETGGPQLLVSDLPQKGTQELLTEQSGIYYGEIQSAYSIAPSKQNEIDHPTETGFVRTNYAGGGGVELDSLARRLAFALRFGDANVALSDRFTKDSTVLMRRNIFERASAVAPFLAFDDDPYIVSTPGGLYWILDGYTTSDNYPNSERYQLSEFSEDRRGEINYIRNSAKVIINAYSGEATIYSVETKDPILEAWSRIFPDVVRPLESMPTELRAHLRYPEDLFVIQTNVYGQYHVEDPEEFFGRGDVWQVPNDPVLSTGNSKVPLEPYYVVMKIPGEAEAEFLLMQPFTIAKTPTLNGWMAARSDPKNYGELVSFSFPSGETIQGPENVSAFINADAVISAQRSLWDRSGSKVREGSLLVVPIGDSLIYVQPLYLQAENSPIPQLERVVVYYDGRIGFERTFEESLAKVLSGEAPVVVPVDKPTPPGTDQPPSTDDLQAAIDAFSRASAALRNGDLAGYQREIEVARAAVERARK